MIKAWLLSGDLESFYCKLAMLAVVAIGGGIAVTSFAVGFATKYLLS